MSNGDTPRPPKGRRLAGALTGLVLGGAAFVLPSGVANAASDGPPPLPANAGDIALTPDEIPAGAVRATHPMPKPGSSGSAFSGRATLKPGDSRIIGGELVAPAAHPSVVAVMSYFVAWDDQADEYAWFLRTCTGTVLSPTKVLTAAQCSVDLPFGATFVVAGRADVRQGVAGSGGQVARVASTWTHQGYNHAEQEKVWTSPSSGNPYPHDNVTVLTLKDALDGAYTPVTLPAQGADIPPADTAATIVGYGVDDGVNNTGVGLLRATTVPIIADSTCSSAYDFFKFNAYSMLCAGVPYSNGACHGDSGGPLFVDGVQYGIISTRFKGYCPADHGIYMRVPTFHDLITEDMARSGLVNPDWTGDGHSDFMVRCKTSGTSTDVCSKSGEVIMFGGSGLYKDGYYGFNAAMSLGYGWNTYTKIMRVTSWNGDGEPSIIARDGSGGLWQYTIGGDGNLLPRIKIGSGWNMFNDIMVTNNWVGDGMPNLMGRKPNGELWIYTSDGAGGWKNPSGTRIGTGWGMFNTILTPGSWQGDGFQTLLGRKPDGKLFMYNSNGSGGWQNPSGTQIGSGWQTFTTFMSPGDWNGDNMIDLVGVKSTGEVRLYTTNGKGQWINATGAVIAKGWQIFDRVF